MNPYNLRMALLSIRGRPVISALIVFAIATGIGAMMTTLNIYHLAGSNPIPHKSDRLLHVQLDSTPIENEYEPGGEPPRDQISWTDARNLSALGGAVRQAGMFKSGFALDLPDSEAPPQLVIARVTERDFFAMFDLNFVYGDAWSAEVDDLARQQVVLKRSLAEELFGDVDPTGQIVRLEEQPFVVQGVVEDFEPQPKFYDLTNGSFNPGEDIYVPLSLAPVLELPVWGNMNCSGDAITNYEERLASNCTWLTYWAELESAAQREAFDTLIGGYVEEQHELGRYEREPNWRIRNVGEWLAFEEVASDDMQVMVWLALLFLAVCLLNTIGLILAKFHARAPQLALRRAVGAPRGSLMAQALVEIGLLGFFGGLLGIAFTTFGLRGMRGFFPEAVADALLTLDWQIIIAAIVVAVSAALIAGLYPSWRVSRLAPAAFLKTQ